MTLGGEMRGGSGGGGGGDTMGGEVTTGLGETYIMDGDMYEEVDTIVWLCGCWLCWLCVAVCAVCVCA